MPGDGWAAEGVAACSISGSATMPGRNSVILPPTSNTTVDSMPTGQGPPSSTGRASPKAALTCSAVVGERPEKRLALGAATGTPARLISASAMGCAGTRTPTVHNPAVTISGIEGAFGSTSVSGPGQYF